jgi:hypothetical protein
LRRGTARLRTDLEKLKEEAIDGHWLTTPWAHIEPAMAYQLGLPVARLWLRHEIRSGATGTAP